MEIYVHRPTSGRMDLVVVEESATLGAVVGLADGDAVWVEDGDAPLDPSLTLSEAGIRHRSHIHVNRCRSVRVQVTYHGPPPREEDFGPAARLQAVFDWATGKKGFDLSREDKAEYALQVCESTDQPELSDHVGSLVIDGSCDVCFDLVAKHNIQG
jgi:hypothetical protein